MEIDDGVPCRRCRRGFTRCSRCSNTSANILVEELLVEDTHEYRLLHIRDITLKTQPVFTWRHLIAIVQAIGSNAEEKRDLCIHLFPLVLERPITEQERADRRKRGRRRTKTYNPTEAEWAELEEITGGRRASLMRSVQLHRLEILREVKTNRTVRDITTCISSAIQRGIYAHTQQQQQPSLPMQRQSFGEPIMRISVRAIPIESRNTSLQHRSIHQHRNRVAVRGQNRNRVLMRDKLHVHLQDTPVPVAAEWARQCVSCLTNFARVILECGCQTLCVTCAYGLLQKDHTIKKNCPQCRKPIIGLTVLSAKEPAAAATKTSSSRTVIESTAEDLAIVVEMD